MSITTKALARYEASYGQAPAETLIGIYHEPAHGLVKVVVGEDGPVVVYAVNHTATGQIRLKEIT